MCKMKQKSTSKQVKSKNYFHGDAQLLGIQNTKSEH